MIPKNGTEVQFHSIGPSAFFLSYKKLMRLLLQDILKESFSQIINLDFAKTILLFSNATGWLLKSTTPTNPSNIARSYLESYLSNRKFIFSVNNKYCKVYPIRASKPQSSVLIPFWYNLFTFDFTTSLNTTIAFFFDDSANTSRDSNFSVASTILQNHISFIETWTKNCRIIDQWLLLS